MTNFDFEFNKKATNSEIQILGQYLKQWVKLQNFETRMNFQSVSAPSCLFSMQFQAEWRGTRNESEFSWVFPPTLDK